VGTACHSCLAKSGLSPTGVFDKVVCSVCGGRGVVDPVAEAGQEQALSRGVLVFALILCVLGLGGVSVSAYVYYRAVHMYDDAPGLLIRGDAPGAPLPQSKADVLKQVPQGATPDVVRGLLGEPHARQVEPQGTHEGLRGEIAQWWYKCSDGTVQITFLNGKVYGKAGQ
jgi:hypothetical protein